MSTTVAGQQSRELSELERNREKAAAHTKKIKVPGARQSVQQQTHRAPVLHTGHLMKVD